MALAPFLPPEGHRAGAAAAGGTPPDGPRQPKDPDPAAGAAPTITVPGLRKTGCPAVRTQGLARLPSGKDAARRDTG